MTSPRSRHCRSLNLFLVLAGLLSFSCSAPQQEPASPASLLPPVSAPVADQAVVTAAAGSVFVLRNGAWTPVHPGFFLQASDILRVTEGSSCEIQAGSGLKVVIGPSSLVSLLDITSTEKSASLSADLIGGSLAARAAPGEGNHTLTLLSGPAEITLKEGKASAVRQGEETRIAASEGSLSLKTPEGSLQLQGGQEASVAPGTPPRMTETEGLAEDLLARTDAPPITDWRDVAVVRFTIKTTPGDAQIFQGNRPLGTGVYSSLLKVGSVLGFTVRKPGFTPKPLTVASEKDEEISVTLDPAPPEEGTGAEPGAEEALRQLEEELAAAQTRSRTLESDLAAGKEQLKVLDRERLDLNARVEKLDQRSRQLEAQAEVAKKEKESLSESLRRSEAQRKTLAEALSAKMKELQATLEANQ